MSLDLTKVAKVLDTAADYFDAVEAEKQSSVKAERQASIDTLAAKYATATGEEMPEGIRKKLADSDREVVAFVQSMTEKQAGTVEALGGPSNRDDEKPVLSTKEAAEAADERFGRWLIDG